MTSKALQGVLLLCYGGVSDRLSTPAGNPPIPVIILDLRVVIGASQYISVSRKEYFASFFNNNNNSN